MADYENDTVAITIKRPDNARPPRPPFPFFITEGTEFTESDPRPADRSVPASVNQCLNAPPTPHTGPCTADYPLPGGSIRIQGIRDQ